MVSHLERPPRSGLPDDVLRQQQGHLKYSNTFVFRRRCLSGPVVGVRILLGLDKVGNVHESFHRLI